MLIYRTALTACMIFVTALGVAMSPKQAAAQKDGKPPNVLLILADDLGFSDLGCYGSEIATPTLDRLAVDGLRYTNFYNTARCWPTRGAILTGYYAQQIHRDALPGKQGGSRGVRPDWAPLLPEMLKPLGYRSYISGKWHIDGKPQECGFDHSYIIEDHDRFFDPRKHEQDGKQLPPVKDNKDYYLTTAIADHAIDCLKEHAAQHSQQPFFHFLTFTSPHFPLQAPAEVVAKYRAQYRVGWDAIRSARFAKQHEMKLTRTKLGVLEEKIGPPYPFPDAIKQLGAGEVIRELAWDALTQEQREFQANKMAVHAAMIDVMDREIGRVIEQLKTMGSFDDTLVLFLSDNGASAEIMIRGDGHDPQAEPGSRGTFLCLGPGWSRAANTPHRRHKTWVHEGGISTPLIAHWPKGITVRNELRDRIGHVIDIVPTILELAGGSAPKFDGAPAMPGRSFASSFKDNASRREEPLWFLHEGNRALRTEGWKITAAKDESWQLYDMQSDRAESTDLSQQHPEVRDKLVEQWTKMTSEMVQLLEAAK